LIGQLKNNGVELIICGQTLADKKFELDWINPDMKVALSALIVLSTYQLKGYAWLPF
jgi:intracellular sulfur oxidation DsrE/DsrF family protein